MNQQNGQNTNPKQGGLSWSTPDKPAPSPAAPKQEAPKQEHKNEKPQPKPAAAPAPTREGNAATIAAWLAGGVVVGVVVAWGATSLLRHAPAGSVGTTAGSLQNATSTSDTAGQGSDPSLTVASPQKAGTSVAIAKAVVSEPTWIVVQESIGGKPGNVLGAKLFFPDTQSGSVELLRGTVAGQSYFVSKRLDNGDHKFSLKADQPVTENGQQLWVTFSAN